MRAVIVTLDDEILAIAGVARDPEHGKFFSEHSNKLTPYLGSITVWRAIKKAMEFVKEYRGPVVAVSAHVDGVVNLTRLGFTHIQGEYFLWLN